MNLGCTKTMAEKVILATVSDDRYGRKDGKYSQTQDFILNLFLQNSQFGIRDFSFWKWEDILKTTFYKDNKKLLDSPDPAINGRCYKPFIICEALKVANEGDYVIYNDVSPEWWINKKIDYNLYNLDVIKQMCTYNGGILSSSALWVCNNEWIADHTHENFTLEQCMNKMNMKEYKYSLQHASGMIVLQKNKKSIEFAEEWKYWNCIEECAGLGSWDYEVNEYGKIGHRHDQSISGLLINKMNNRLVDARYDPLNHPRDSGNYCFLSFCIPQRSYHFIESNQPAGEYKYKNIFNGTEWEYIRLIR